MKKKKGKGGGGGKKESKKKRKKDFHNSSGFSAESISICIPSFGAKLEEQLNQAATLTIYISNTNSTTRHSSYSMNLLPNGQ